MKKLLSTLLICCVVAISPKSHAFIDVHPEDWYYSYITEASALGLVEGYSDDSFRPDDNLTLAEFSTMLANAFYGTSLTIVSTEEFVEWWEPFVYTTYLRDGVRYTNVDLSIQDFLERGYLFNRWGEYVHQPLTRYDMAAMVSNVLIDRFTTRYTQSESTTTLNKITDVAANSYYGISVAMAYDAGIISGKRGNYFLGDDLMTRAEATVVLSALAESEAVSLELYSNGDMELSSPVFNVSSYDYTGNLAVENYVFARTNQLREANGLAPVEHRDTLVEYAYTRSLETTTLFSHTRPDGSAWNSVFPEEDTDHSPSGENLTMGSGFQHFQFADMIFKAWLNSPGHYTNMLDARHTTLGIAVYVDDGGAYYATQIFGR